MPSTTSLLTTLALAAALTPAAAAAQDTPAEPPRALEGVAVIAAPELGKGTFAVHFRTDRALDRKQNGRSLRGWVGFAKGRSSISTDRRAPAGTHCYVGYVTSSKLRAGQHTTVRVNLGDRTITKRTTAVKPVKAVKGGAGIGC